MIDSTPSSNLCTHAHLLRLFRVATDLHTTLNLCMGRLALQIFVLSPSRSRTTRIQFQTP